MSWKLRLCLLLLAIDTTAITVLDSGLIRDWGQWYGTSVPYRRQTDAFFDGRLALSENPGTIDFDMVWTNGSVQQVWGLGVPLWRFPFEVVARAFGQAAFPDRIALALAIMISAYWILKAVAVPPGIAQISAWGDSVFKKPGAIIAALVVTFFPQALMLCRGPMNVYEEPVLYSYYLSVGLLAAAIYFNRRPTFLAYLVISLIAGAAGFVRPTSLAYGGATMLTIGLCGLSARWSWRHLLIGPILFALGGALLGFTNWVRFGAFGEFGHRLNLTGMDMLLFSRFHAPYVNEPLWPALKELFSALFAVDRFNELGEAYAGDILRWQSPTTRWRHFYESTFDFSHLAMLAGGIAIAAASFRKAMARHVEKLQSPAVVAAIWSTVSFAVLSMFYLNFHCISSRYILDYSPAFAAASLACISRHDELVAFAQPISRHSRILLKFSLVAWLGWWGMELDRCKNYYPASPVWTQEVALQAGERNNAEVVIPSSYIVCDIKDREFQDDLAGIPFNGLGWTEGGRTKSVVMLFVQDPSFIELQIAAAPGMSPSQTQWNSIQAKIGITFLNRQSVVQQGANRVIRFAAEDDRQAFAGTQVAFVSFPLTDGIGEGAIPDEGLSPFFLERVTWRKRQADLNRWTGSGVE
ncbi:MAG: hypothetical protein CMJ58_25745 [Planctomycetaceae bacterium]|nr:hypothetical protein [Planctomycetaceae bacterium]